MTTPTTLERHHKPLYDASPRPGELQTLGKASLAGFHPTPDVALMKLHIHLPKKILREISNGYAERLSCPRFGLWISVHSRDVWRGRQCELSAATAVRRLPWNRNRCARRKA